MGPAVTRFEEATPAVMVATEGRVKVSPNSTAKSAADWAVAAYIMAGFIPLVWLPLDPGPRLLGLLVLAGLLVVLPPAWAFLGRDTGAVTWSWKEDGVLWLLPELCRAVPLALWLSFGLNACAGQNPGVEQVTTVEEVHLGNIVEVQLWRPEKETRYFYMGKGATGRFLKGQSVTISTRVGFWGWDYVSHDPVVIPPGPPPPTP